MKNRTLPLSLLIGATLAIPSLAMAAPADTAQADVQNAATTTTLETEAGNSANVSVPNPSNSVQISETQIISRASVNSNANQQQMASEQQVQQDPEEAMPQKDLQEDMSQEDMLDEDSMVEEEASSESQEEL